MCSESTRFGHSIASLSLFVFQLMEDAKGELTMARNPEGRFQDGLKKRLFEMFPGCKVFKMEQHQGIPDLLVLWRDKWALLECKRWRSAHKQPNQEYWVDFYDKMSFSRFVSPENIEEVLHDLQQAFRP